MIPRMTLKERIIAWFSKFGEIDVQYLCDHRACDICSNPTHDKRLCNHTSKIEHAVNFEKLGNNCYFEKEDRKNVS